MSQTCDICNRGTVVAYNVSHSKRKTKRTQKINLQSKKIDNKKVKICTSCLKSLGKKAKKQKSKKAKK